MIEKAKTIPTRFVVQGDFKLLSCHSSKIKRSFIPYVGDRGFHTSRSLVNCNISPVLSPAPIALLRGPYRQKIKTFIIRSTLIRSQPLAELTYVEICRTHLAVTYKSGFPIACKQCLLGRLFSATRVYLMNMSR